MLRRSLLLSSLALVGCSDDFAAAQVLADLPDLSTGTTQGPPPATSAPDAETTDDAEVTTTTTSTASTTIDLTTGEDSSTGEGELPPPAILAVDLPAKVHAAGFVPITVMVEHATSVRLEVDGVEGAPLEPSEPDVFVGSIPIRGAIDNFPHPVKIIAARGDLETSTERTLEVDAPAAGTVANTVIGPLGSETSRLTLTPEGDVLEGGSLEIAGVKHPAIRKRSGTTGAEVWPATLVLDTREGYVADVAVTTGGKLWVAMNVRGQGGVWRPRIALFSADGALEDVDLESAPGRTVTAIAADAEGGCLGIGFATVDDDQDIWLRRIDGAHTPTLDDTWDYLGPLFQPHKFMDLGFSVEIEGDVAWIVGASYGGHDLNDPEKRSRGLILRVNLHTGAAIGPAIIAPTAPGWPQSMLYGSALHPSGILVVGQGCTNQCSNQRMETALYSRDTGERLWFAPEPQALTAIGRDVVLDSQGRAIIVGAVRDGGALRGRVVARRVGEDGSPLFSHWFPQDNEESHVLGVVVDGVDRIRAGGHTTLNGQKTARVVFIHP